VIRTGSFSKTLSPLLRVGSLCASRSLVPELLRVKMLAGLTSSEINERVVCDAISARPYRRMVARLATRLDGARDEAIVALRQAGLEPIAAPRGGMFVSAGFKDAPTPGFNGRVVAERALKAGIQLAPGEFFTLRQSDSVWFRFNVAYAADPALLRFLQSIR
jgi:DNA-binding transcriptional MocR family regulator